MAAYNAYVANLDNYGVYSKMAEGSGFFSECRANIAAANGNMAQVPVPVHQGFCNVSFYDGHAKAIKLSQYWLPKSKSNLWGTDKDYFGLNTGHPGDNNEASCHPAPPY